jgi:hypothetical protein
MKAKAQNVGPKIERESASMGGYRPEAQKPSAKAKKVHFFPALVEIKSMPLYRIFFSRFYTYFIIQYSSRLSSRDGPNLAEWYR